MPVTTPHNNLDMAIDLDFIVKFAEIEKRAKLVNEEINSSSKFSVEELSDFFFSLHPDSTVIRLYHFDDTSLHIEPLFITIRKELIELTRDHRWDDDKENSSTITSKKTLKTHVLRHATVGFLSRAIKTEKVVSIDGYPAIKVPFILPCDHMADDYCKNSVSYMVWKEHDCPVVFCTSCGNYIND